MNPGHEMLRTRYFPPVTPPIIWKNVSTPPRLARLFYVSPWPSTDEPREELQARAIMHVTVPSGTLGWVG